MPSYDPDARGPRRPARRAAANSAQGENPLKRLISSIDATADANLAQSVVEPQKIEPGRRLIALGIDFGAAYLVFLGVALIPFLNHYFSAQLVIPVVMCVRDYLFNGRGVGKNLMGLRVVDMASGLAPSIFQVIKRNAIYLGPLVLLEALFTILHILPFQSFFQPLKTALNFIGSAYTLVILPIEVWRSLQREDSLRLGDALAGTCIVDSPMSFEDALSRNRQ